jgi:hypothetical protein
MQHLLPNNNHARKRRLLPLADKEKYLPAAGPWPVFSALFSIVHTFLNFVLMKALFKHALLIIAGTLLCVFHSCKREPPPKDPITITYGLDDAKNYMCFNKGSYWVYEHDITKEIDSQWVQDLAIGQSTQKGREEWSKHITLVQETFYIDVRSNFRDGHGNISRWIIRSSGQLVDAFPYPGRAYQFEKTLIQSGPKATSGENTVFYHPFNLCPKKDCFYYFDTILTNFKLGSLSFDTVRRFKIVQNDYVMQQCSVPCYGGKSDYYYAKGVGLIKIYNESFRWFDQTPMNHSWNLKRYRIVK